MFENLELIFIEKPYSHEVQCDPEKDTLIFHGNIPTIEESLDDFKFVYIPKRNEEQFKINFNGKFNGSFRVIDPFSKRCLSSEEIKYLRKVIIGAGSLIINYYNTIGGYYTTEHDDNYWSNRIKAKIKDL